MKEKEKVETKLNTTQFFLKRGNKQRRYSNTWHAQQSNVLKFGSKLTLFALFEVIQDKNWTQIIQAGGTKSKFRQPLQAAAALGWTQ